MTPPQHVANATDTGLLTLAIASIAGWLPTAIMVLTAVAGVVRLYLMWLDVRLKRKALKEGPDAQRELPKGD